MNSVAKACTLNNQGVDSLALGNTANAMASFRGALKILKLATDEMPSQHQRMTTGAAAFPSSTSSTSEGNSSVTNQVSLCIVTSEVITPGNEHNYMYNHGLVIVDQGIQKQNGCSGDTEISRYSAVALFNWALAFHREGKRGHGDAKYLDNALHLYKLSLLPPQGSVLGSIGESKDATSNFLTVAALNNMAQIYFDRLQYTESLASMDQIARILDETENLEESLLSHMDMAVIFHNTLFLHEPTCAHAA